jgi:2-keto-4-pentenoate hydratase/2-oxohepta-3-ene-1,7-dioic acid hydratase in catechol pathway
MKLCRFGPEGAEKPALVDEDGRLRDLSAHIPDLGPDQLSPATLAKLAALDPANLPLVPMGERYGPCVTGTRHFIAIGLNYADHAAESNMPIPAEPVVFNKWVSCIQGPNDPIIIPKDSEKTDWEVELGVIIGSETFMVREADALAHVAGYCVINDVSERHWQQERGLTWDKGKGFPSFGPIGPWLVTPDEVGDPHNLAMWLSINGNKVQDGSSKTMIFQIPQIIAYVSQFVKLLPGDIITTGTPPGVGLGQKPEPWYLKAGDVVELGIEKLGEQRQICIAYTPIR